MFCWRKTANCNHGTKEESDCGLARNSIISQNWTKGSVHSNSAINIYCWVNANINLTLLVNGG